jgi:hypothetical protein
MTFLVLVPLTRSPTPSSFPRQVRSQNGLYFLRADFMTELVVDKL